MTREEIMQLNTDYLNGCESEHKMNELFSYALEQEPVTTTNNDEPITVIYPTIVCDDAISRILKRMWNCRGKHTTSIDKVAMEQIIRDELPSVTRQTGEWIFVDKAHEHAHCSECDYGDVDLLDGRPHNYCPRCGAKMQESEDKE